MTRADITSHRIHHRKGALAVLLATLGHFARRRRDRTRLAQLDPHLLRDIGLDDATAAKECAKPFWRS